MIKIKFFKESKDNNFDKWISMTPESFMELIENEGLPKIAYRNNQPIQEEIKFYDGKVGQSNHITCEAKINLPLDYVKTLKGEVGEVREWHIINLPKKNVPFYMFGNYGIDEWYEFIKDIAENGLKWPIFITVDWNERPKINEGNHRVQAFSQLKLTTIPCNVRFFGKAEDTLELIDKILVDKIKEV